LYKIIKKWYSINISGGKKMIKENTVVQIERVVLKSVERTGNLPDDTKRVPLKMKLKGRLVTKSNLGDYVKIVTQTNRIDEGYLIDVEPYFKHDYGHYVEVLDEVKDIILRENENSL
ncbi:MAG: 2-amino-4-oxopentanoate thiolase subunit OrtA, partial [Bacilli bacterium]